MNKLEGTKTLENLKEAFAGESQAHTKYLYYAAQAKKDGYVQLQNIFTETAVNEKEHAKIWFKLMHGGKVPTTVENLKDCIEGENYEHTDMYVRMAKDAREEGFDDIAALFEGVGAIEKDHEERYQKFLNNINEGIVFKREEEQVWICKNCGKVHVGKEAPMICPVCDHPQAHYEIQATNY